METLTLTLLPPPPGRLGRGGRPVRERTAGAPSCRAGQELSRRPWRQLGAAQPLEGTKDPHWAARARLPSRPGAAERGRLRSAAGKGGRGGGDGDRRGAGVPRDRRGAAPARDGAFCSAQSRERGDEARPCLPRQLCGAPPGFCRMAALGWRAFRPPPPVRRVNPKPELCFRKHLRRRRLNSHLFCNRGR